MMLTHCGNCHERDQQLGVPCVECGHLAHARGRTSSDRRFPVAEGFARDLIGLGVLRAPILVGEWLNS